MIRSIPTAPGAVPVLGHLIPLLRDPAGFAAGLPALGDLVRVRLGPSDAVVVCEPGLTLQVLRDDRTFDKGGPLFERVREAFGDGLGSSPHNLHRRQRRLVQSAFQPSRLEGYADIMSAHAGTVVGSWHDGQILNVQREMMTLAARITTAALFSGALSEPELRAMLDDIGTVFSGIYSRTVTPAPLDRLPTPANRRYREAITGLRASAGAVIADRRGSDVDHGDLLSALLSSRDTSGDGDRLSDDEVTDQALGFLVGGTETTASLLSWAWHMLACNPDIQDRLHAEVDTVLGGRPATHADLPRLDLTSRVITETLRLRPPGWLLSRVVTAATRLGDADLPVGTTVLFSPYVLHHRADLFPDPSRFDPDRWHGDDHKALPRGAFIPFGGGARKCIGDQFGTTEAVLVLATIASHWRLEPLSGEQVRVSTAITMRPRRLRMRAAARKVAVPD